MQIKINVRMILRLEYLVKVSVYCIEDENKIHFECRIFKILIEN